MMMSTIPECILF